MTENAHPWYAEEAGFFGPDYLVEYEDILRPEHTIQQVEFLRRILSLNCSMKILDLPCGHGRHSVEFAKRGYDVTGVDLNNFFLGKAREAAKAEGVSVRLLQGDMREISFEEEFDIALNLFTALGYFEDDEDDRKVLSGIFKSLKPGGKFVLDFLNRDWLARNFKEKDWRRLSDGSILMIERSHDPIRGRNQDRRIQFKDGKEMPRVRFLDHRVYSTVELVKMAESVGFTFLKAYGGYDESPPSIYTRRIILLFEKP